ncbi:MAG: T9SS type A sorting domain-containing protein [Sporocytophaga sp.]|uniref:ligand-binding sensor domain-containing protein n=1 Tax=Sporocytophaga sp. TaxID=2231183 RepID=UPI001B0B4114|nr:two-component regulator propeller domain-containing protein [Sporocytophaga sp.]MBO9703465.1 T9SS type A sorting domain-containing protein [Sporocytophaga sp.]
MKNYFPFCKNLFALIVFLFSSNISYSQTWTNYTNTQEVNSIVIDKDSVVWCATEGGVAKYDGAVWTKYTTADGLIEGRTKHIAIDSNNYVWVATMSGVSKFNGQRWQNCSPFDPSNELNFATALASDKYGNIWYGKSGRGAYKFNGTSWINYLNDIVVNCITTDKWGRVWIGTHEGMYKFDGVNWVKFTTADGLFDNQIVDIAIDQNGAKWITYGVGYGISKFDDLNWTYYDAPIGSNLRLKSVTIDNLGNKWIAAIDGVYNADCEIFKFDGTTWTNQNYLNNYAWDGIISSITVDSKGNKWCATKRGIQFFSYDNSWSHLPVFNNTNGLVNKSITAIAVENNGIQWIGTYNGVSRFDGKNWKNFTTKDGLCSPIVTAIAIDSSGNQWIGTRDGLSRFDGNQWMTYNTSNGLPYNYINSIAVDHNNVVWVGTLQGAAAFDGTSWKIYRQSDGLSSTSINSIAIDLQGNKWFGTSNGISKYDDNIWKTVLGNQGSCLVFDSFNSLWFKESVRENQSVYWSDVLYKYDGTILTKVQVYAATINYIAIDKVGDKWLSIDGGVSKYDDSVWTYFNSFDIEHEESDNNFKGIIGKKVTCIATDKDGNLLFGMDNGLTVFDGKIKWNDYNIEKGLANNKVFSIAIDKKGNKWMATGDGISQFDDVNWFTYESASYKSHYYLYTSRLMIDHLDNKWFSQNDTYWDHLFRFNDTTLAYRGEHASGNEVDFFTVDMNENVWMNDGGWISMINEFGGCKFYVPLDPKYIYIDKQNNKWFGFKSSLELGQEKLYGNGFGTIEWSQSIDLSSNFNVSQVTVAFFDSKGNKWIGTNAGLYCHKGSSLKLYTMEDGLADNYINSIVADSSGNLWVGSNGGVSKFDGTTWHNYTTVDGLADNIVYSIDIDSEGNKWFATDNGVSKFSDNNISTGIYQQANVNLSKISLTSRVNIYPNPTSNNISFEGVKSESTIEILTMNGQLLKSVLYSDNSIDISKLEKGMYLVRILNSEFIETKKLLKQ